MPRAGWQRSILKALFPDQPAATEAATVLLAQDFAQDLHVQGLREVDDEDWVRITQAQFQPLPITDSFWIVPSWHETPAAATVAMKLDPGEKYFRDPPPRIDMSLSYAGSALMIAEEMRVYREERTARAADTRPAKAPTAPAKVVPVAAASPGGAAPATGGR